MELRGLFSRKEVEFILILALAGILLYISGLDYALADMLGQRTPTGLSLFVSSWYYVAFEISAFCYLWVKNRRAFASLLASSILLYVMQVAITEIHARERPAEAMQIGGQLMDLIYRTGASSSFFSGHAATVAAACTMFLIIGARPFLVLFLALPIFISRLTLVQHYPSDVAYGIVFGYVTAKIVHALISGMYAGRVLTKVK
ncbi:MAG: phosphatase PAP2 family protein [Candidatus Altiarchaeota archaeon]|nr:phosphatase PAP2 family protein [Candidatus Altiarchaeota archaeon]